MSKEESPIEAEALAAVGTERLATLLAEVAMTNPGVRRRLQFEVSSQRGEDVAPSVDQWICEIGEQTSFLDAQEVDETAEELDAMRVAIVSDISGAAPNLAPELMWRLFTLAGTIFERTTEEGCELSCIFDKACFDLVDLSVKADVEPAIFAERVVAAIVTNNYGEYRALIRAIASAQPRAPAYGSELKNSLQRSLDKPSGSVNSLDSKRRVFHQALLELGSFCAT
ncbi:DUF6880 family protein [Caballeronia sp. LZ001]|uniref:DUF6880 family protein n=1 Tax=Caballeronia sp. LZ001 TaxID=3038553 RepID=UPI002860EE9A|nr:DUF6880 family protein [Caballeronia sp. LZ001]MDR5806341.1 hypothetical protein [Caballeronia sp. LZ001]